MAFPSFSYPGVTTLTFSRGNLFPTRQTYEPRQLVGVSEAGTVRVAMLSAPEQVLILVFKGLPSADYTNLIAFFTAINWGAVAFTYTDTSGTTSSVRFLEALDMPQVNAGLYDLTISLRLEIA